MGSVGLGALLALPQGGVALTAGGEEKEEEEKVELEETTPDDGAAAEGGGKDDDGEDDVVSMAIEKTKILTSKLGVGGLSGFCAGYFFKKIGKMACFAVGGMFVLFQSMAYAGFIDIHWNKIEQKMEKIADLDGDGKLTMSDVAVFWKKYLKPMLTYHLPSGAGFSFGFLMGIKKG